MDLQKQKEAIARNMESKRKALDKAKNGQFLSDIRPHGDNLEHGKNKVKGRNGYHGMDYEPNKTKIVKD
jgi:hypothetical protein